MTFNTCMQSCKTIFVLDIIFPGQWMSSYESVLRFFSAMHGKVSPLSDNFFPIHLLLVLKSNRDRKCYKCYIQGFGF